MDHWQHLVSHETFRELSKQGKVFKLTARFEDGTPPKCKIIYMWYEGLSKAVTYATRLRIFSECTTVGVGILNIITKTRIHQNGIIEPSKHGPTPSSTDLEHLLIDGYFA